MLIIVSSMNTFQVWILILILCIHRRHSEYCTLYKQHLHILSSTACMSGNYDILHSLLSNSVIILAWVTEGVLIRYSFWEFLLWPGRTLKCAYRAQTTGHCGQECRSHCSKWADVNVVLVTSLFPWLAFQLLPTMLQLFWASEVQVRGRYILMLVLSLHMKHDKWMCSSTGIMQILSTFRT